MWGVLALPPLHAANWDLTPSVGVGLIRSDNIDLAPPGAEVSDTVLEVTPGIDARYEGRRADADVSYRMQSLTYQDDSDRNEIFHHLSARGTAELAEDSFFLDGGLAIRQQVVDPTAAVPTGTIAGAGNLTDEYTAYISPHWTIGLTDNVRADIRYALGTVRYDDDALDDSVQHALAAMVETAPQPDRLYWALRHRQARVDFDDADDVRIAQTTAEAGIPVTSATRLVLIGGWESNEFELADGSDAPDDTMWMAGIRSQRGTRFELEILAGERFFGDTYRLNWIQRGPRWQTRALYEEDFITYAETRLEIDPRSPESILPGPGLGTAVGEVYLRERGQIDFTFETARTRSTARIYDERRLYQSTDREETLKGFDAGWDWRIRERTTLRLSGGIQETQLVEIDSPDELTLLTIGVEQQLGRRVVGSLLVRRTEVTSDIADREYRENSVAARLIATF